MHGKLSWILVIQIIIFALGGAADRSGLIHVGDEVIGNVNCFHNCRFFYDSDFIYRS